MSINQMKKKCEATRKDGTVCGASGVLTKHKSVENEEEEMIWKCRDCMNGDDSDLSIDNFSTQYSALANYERLPSHEEGTTKGSNAELNDHWERQLIRIGLGKVNPLFRHKYANAYADENK